MKSVVIMTRSCPYGSNTPDYIVCKAISEALNCPLIHNPFTLAEHDGDYDVVFVKPGVFVYSAHFRPDLPGWNLLVKAKKVFIISIDYNDFKPEGLYPIDKRYMNANPNYTWICNSPVLAKKVNGLYFPLNASTYHKYAINAPRSDVPLYYGKYRPDRKDIMLKYMDKRPWIISTFPKEIAKFTAALPRPVIQYAKAMKNTPLQLSTFKYGLYIEDVKSQSIDSLAMRFYEMVAADMIFGIDQPSARAFKYMGCTDVELEPFIVTDEKSYFKKIVGRYDVLKRTYFYKKWYFVDYRAVLMRELKKGLRTYVAR